MVGIKDFEMPSCCNSCGHWSFSHDDEPLCDLTYEYIRQFDKRQNDCPLVEAIPKANYEARLRADMVAALKELQLEIEEIETGGDAWELAIKDDCKAVIQKKIDALEYDLERGNNGNNVRQTD